jgi:hypothetical protein
MKRMGTRSCEWPCAWLRTERLKNRCAINARVGVRLLPVLQTIFRKSLEIGLQIPSQYQLLTSSVPNPRSREVWRKTGGEKEF